MNQPASLPLVASLLDAPLPASGIAWLDEARRENRAAFAVGGLPGARVEAWKYTALRGLGQRRFAAGDAGAATRDVDAAEFALPGVGGPQLVFVNGVFRADLSALEALPDGLSLQPLAQALRDDAEPLRFALSRPALVGHVREGGDAFVQVNAASAADGVVLKVAAHATIAVPVQLVFVGTAAESELAWHARNLIELGEGASLALVEHHVGHGEQAQLATLVGDVELHEGAQLHYTVLQNTATGAHLIRRSGLRLHARAQMRLHVLELGGALVRHDLQAELVGDGAQLHTRGVFRGAILVAPGADGSDASLTNKNLLLSPSAEIDTKPELEIYADEVQAAHGATVGQLDERSLFYLRSRGIPLAEARALLTAAFCRAVLDDVPNEALREHLSALLSAQLPD